MKIFILILTFIALPSRFNGENSSQIKLRKFSIFPILSAMAKSYELQQRLLEEIERQEMRRNNEKIAKEEAKQRKVFQQYIDSLKSKSSFLTDFHADRFF